MSPSFLLILVFFFGLADSQLLRVRRYWGDNLGAAGAAEVAREIQTEEAIREAEVEAQIENSQIGQPMGPMIGNTFGGLGAAPYGGSMGFPYADSAAQTPTASFGRSRIVLASDSAPASPQGYSAILEAARRAGLP